MKVVSGTMLTLILIAVTLTLNIRPAMSSGTIYIRVDGSIDPPTAPISTINNVTYVFADSISDWIRVERNDIVIDGAGYTLHGPGIIRGIDLTGRKNVTVMNTQINNFDYGIWLGSTSNYNSIIGNNITSNSYGIWLEDSSSNNGVTGNNITNNSYGISLFSSSSNDISGNNITGNYQCIQLDSSSNNRITGNNIAGNTIGIRLSSSNYNNIIGNAIIDNSDGISLVSSNYNSISGNDITDDTFYGISFDSSSSNNISRNNIEGSTFHGINLRGSSNNSIIENAIANNYYGVFIEGSSSNNIDGNNITDNDENIRLYSSSEYNVVSGNVFTGDGLTVWNSYHNVVEDNTVNGKPLVYLEGVVDYAVGDAGQVILVNCTRIIVENLNVSWTNNGIQLWQTSNSSIASNTIVNNYYGIRLEFFSNYNSISENNIADNFYGIYFNSSFSNSIIGNNIGNNSQGVRLAGSSNYNSVNDNDIGANFYGIWLEDSSSNSISRNNIIANDEGIWSPFSCNYNSISQNKIATSEYGIMFSSSSFNSISENNLVHNWLGISIRSSSNFNVSRNNIIGDITNINYGIQLHSASGSRVSGNNITGTYCGIDLEYASAASVFGNNIEASTWVGIRLILASNNNSISGNGITANKCGIFFDSSSSYNNISENNIVNNSYGILLEYSSNNRFFHNYFIDNSQQVSVSSGYANIWDDGYPSGGNLWSNYNGTDVYNGTDQNSLGKDFIGDTPHVINLNNTDRYPLLIPCKTKPPAITILSPENETYSVNILPFTFIVNETISWMGYSLDGQQNVTIMGNTTLTGMSDGPHYLIAYANDIFDNMGMSVVYFAADTIPPAANAGPDQTVDEDTVVKFDGSASTDNGGIARYIWTFTDGILKYLTEDRPTYTFSSPGVYTIALNVTDAAGNWAADTVTITVLDVTDPAANAGQDQIVNYGETVSFDAGGSADNVGIVSYEWDFGDGAKDSGKTATHAYASAGTYTVTLTVKDAAGNTATDALTVTVTVTALSTEAFPIIWIAGPAVAITVVAAAAIFLWRRRKYSEGVLSSGAPGTSAPEAVPKPKKPWLKIALVVILVAVVVGAGFAYWWFSRSPSVPWLFKGAYGNYKGTTTINSVTIDITFRFEVVDFNATHGKLLTYMKMTYPTELHLDPYEYQTTTWSEIYGTSYETPGATLLSKIEDHAYFERYGTRSCTVAKYSYQETDSSFNMTMYVDKETGWPLKIQYEYTRPIVCSFDLELLETNIPGLG